jgi:hypothetical protein
MWRVSPLRKVRQCRRFAADPDATTVPLRMSTGEDGRVSVGFGGLKVCGSWSCCIVCAARIAVHRAEELSHIFRVWQAMGGSVVLMTLSARHHKGQALGDLVTGLRAGWKAVRSGRPWKRDEIALGVEWLIRAFETTNGDQHGWHPHYHAFLLVSDPVSVEYAREVGARMWQRWCAGLATRGMTAVASVFRDGAIKDDQFGAKMAESAGFDVRVLSPGDDLSELSGYPFKAALEATGAVFKRGRHVDGYGNTEGYRHRNPFEIMESYALAVAEGDADGARADLALITEWSETAAEMRFRQCPLPPGMREFFAEKARELGIPGPLLEAEQTDEEVAGEDVAGAQTVAHVPVRAYTGQVVFELDTLRLAARRGGVPAVIAWFKQRGIPIELTDWGRQPEGRCA